MAIDPRIVQSIGQRSNINSVNAFERALQSIRRQGQERTQREQQAQTNQLLANVFQQQPVQQVGPGAGIAGPPEQQQTAPVVSQQALIDLSVERPELFEQVNKNIGLITTQQKSEAADFAFDVVNTPFEQRREKIIQRVERLQSQGRDASDTRQLLNTDQATQDNALNAIQIAALPVEKRVELASGGKRGLASAKTEILKDGSVIQALPDGSVQVRDRLGNVVTGQERSNVLDQSQQAAIAQLQKIGGVEVSTARRVAKAKAGVELKFKPRIQKAVKLAEAEAKTRGETLTTLKRAEAALPGLIQTIDTLKELAPIATSTLGGKIFDTAVKESGFGGTKGATARAKFIAIVSNQVLPLLKDTFGSAFTVAEGDSLRATMGDPDASPAEKIAQLEAFIDQKRRSIETAQREVETTPVAAPQLPPSGRTGGVLNTDASGNRAFVFPDGTFEEVP